MLLAALGIVAGLALLTAAADWFVLGAVRVAARLRLSTLVIGAVVIGFGTSAPEMVVSGLAAGQGELDIAVGNIIGSNIANLSMVLGAAALVTTIGVAHGPPRDWRSAPRWPSHWRSRAACHDRRGCCCSAVWWSCSRG